MSSDVVWVVCLYGMLVGMVGACVGMCVHIHYTDKAYYEDSDVHVPWRSVVVYVLVGCMVLCAGIVYMAAYTQ